MGIGMSTQARARIGTVHWRRSLRTRIALWAGALNLGLLLVLLAAVVWFARQSIVEDARRDTRANAQEAAEGLEATLAGVAVTTRGLADLIAHGNLDDPTLALTMRAMIDATPGAVGGLAILEPRGEGQTAFARYVSARGSIDFIAAGHSYRDRGWYQRTVAAPGGWWSEPYRSALAGDAWVATYNMPLRDRGRGAATRGMVSVDVPLDRLTGPLETLAHLPGWRVSLVAPAGTVALDAEADVSRQEYLEDYVRRSGRLDLMPAVEAVRRGERVQFVHADAGSGQTHYTVVEPIGRSGWTLLVAQFHALIMQRLARAVWMLLGAGALLALACMVVARVLGGHISRPVMQLSEAAAQLARGEYDRAVPQQDRQDEVGLLARTLAQASDAIRRHLREIGDLAAARQKLDSELAIGREIQQAMLPPGRVLECDGHALEAFAQLQPAKAVGGDFYSFIETDGRLWFAIGDISDKGVPAALFMARTVTVLEVMAHAVPSPAAVLMEASRRLIEGNETCMFATVLCGSIDVRSGRCLLASAGHESPWLIEADGSVRTLPLAAGPPLGFEASDAFTVWEGRLRPGQTLLAYTDGVTEAFDPHGEAFGEARLRAALDPARDAGAQCAHVLAQVRAFADPAPQSDDVTVLAIRLRRASAPLAHEETPCSSG